MKAKKSLGQHFLINHHIAQKISDSLETIDGVKNVLEVGPGRGMLTQYLVNRPESVYVVEIDQHLIDQLARMFPGLFVTHANFLKLELDRLLPEPYHLIGNFPYNISSQIIFKLLDNRKSIPQMVGMFQKEVARRIHSGHGSKTYGILSVLVQAFYEVDYLFGVSPSAFSPRPKVESAVIRLRRKAHPLVNNEDERLFRQLVKMAFNQRRKMLRNSLKSLVVQPDTTPFMTLRPEQMTVQDFADLTVNLISSQK